MDLIDRNELLKKLFPYDAVDKKNYSINAQAVYNAVMNVPHVVLTVWEGKDE
jgi:hypothetical protein